MKCELGMNVVFALSLIQAKDIQPHAVSYIKNINFLFFVLLLSLHFGDPDVKKSILSLKHLKLVSTGSLCFP